MDAKFKTLDSYVSDPRWVLVKLHGSADWARPIQGSKIPDRLEGYLRILDDITKSDLDPLTARLGTAPILWQDKRLWNESGSLYPALVAPIARKYEYMCPASHIERLRTVIKASHNLLIIGNSGLDDDLTDLLRDEMGLVMTLGVVAAGDGRTVLERFRQAVPKFQAASVKTYVTENGFSHFITSGKLAEFLNRLYDDDDRDPWLRASNPA
ncbi:MAG: hypothetical protein Q7T33_04885 [Dehalococcoidia bacterium]|nr:hypothetical protein [Dehalococcoidia bacterium]